MVKFEVTIKNGNYPLTYQAINIYDALMCIMEATNCLGAYVYDVEEVMQSLVSMRFGGTMYIENAAFAVQVIDASEELPQ